MKSLMNRVLSDENQDQAFCQTAVSGSGFNVNFLPPVIIPNYHCLCCGTSENHLSFETVLYSNDDGIGFTIYKNSEIYYRLKSGLNYYGSKTLEEINKTAFLEPNNDWRAVINYPKRHGEYQLQNNKWVLVIIKSGFDYHYH